MRMLIVGEWAFWFFCMKLKSKKIHIRIYITHRLLIIPRTIQEFVTHKWGGYMPKLNWGDFVKLKNIIYMLSIGLVLFSLVACMSVKKSETETVPPADSSAAGDKINYIRGHNIPGKYYWAGNAQEKKVALTFDDGPEDHWTPQILDILKEKGVKATFFVIGKQAQLYPDMLRRIDAEGHVIGNHTFDHANLNKATPQQVAQEIDECAATVNKIIGKTPKLVRPPFGFHNTNVDNVVYGKNDVIVLWSVDTEDWKGFDATTVKNRILPKMKNGYIILQHDGTNSRLGGSVLALPDIIDGLKAQGYQFVTIAELLEITPYQ